MATEVGRKTLEEPLVGHPMFVAETPDEAAARAGELLAPHQLRLVDEHRGGFTGRVNGVQFRDCMLAYFRYGAEIEVLSSPLERLYAVNRPLSGHAEVRHRDATITSRQDVAAVFSASAPSSMRWSEDLGVLCLAIDRSALERQLERMIGRPVDAEIEFAPTMTLRAGDSGHHWWGVVGILQNLAERAPHARAAKGVVTQEIEHAVMSTLLLTQPNNYSAVLIAGASAACGHTVDAAVDIMRAEFAGSVSLGEIATRVGVSERSLQLAFRSRLNVSPMTYLKHLRLDHARLLLQTTSPEERSVAQIASDSGLPHLGRFAEAYRNRFGEKPSKTLRR